MKGNSLGRTVTFPFRGRRAKRAALLALAFLAWGPATGAADESLPLKTLNDIKAATVYLKIEAGKDAATGTGFVIQVEGETAYVVTNNHVVDLSVEFRPGLRRPAGPTIVTAVLGSGTPAEQSVRAEVLAADPRADLAVLRLQGVRNPPPPLDLSQEAKLIETMPVFIFGFPLGELLATGKRNPAITVGKGSVSSIRQDELGRLVTVQINGDLTPGNSGGPVVDAQGRLVGVAVATVRNRQIGFTVPAERLKRLLQGHLTDYHFATQPAGPGALEVRVELGIFDPRQRVREARFYYLRQDNPGVKKLATLPGVEQVELHRDGQHLVGKFTLAAPRAGDAPIVFQAAYRNGEGRTFLSNPRIQRFASAAAAPPPVVALPNPPVPPVPVFPGAPRQPLAAAALTQALEDLRSNDNNRRRTAAERLFAAEPGERRQEIVPALAPLLDEKDLFLRTAGVKAYINWAGKDGLPKLHELLKGDCFITRAIVIEALPKLEGAAAAEAIAGRLPDLTNRGPAKKALEAIGPGAEKAVLPYLSHQDWGVRVEVCQILKVIGTAGSLAALKGAAQDANPAVSRAAQEALQEISRRAPGGQPPGAPARGAATGGRPAAHPLV